MTKIIFNYDVYYISDKDTFTLKRDIAYNFEHERQDMLRFEIFQDGKCIVKEIYEYDDKELISIMNLFYQKSDNYKNIEIDKKQFGIQFINKGGCQHG